MSYRPLLNNLFFWSSGPPIWDSQQVLRSSFFFVFPSNKGIFWIQGLIHLNLRYSRSIRCYADPRSRRLGRNSTLRGPNHRPDILRGQRPRRVYILPKFSTLMIRWFSALTCIPSTNFCKLFNQEGSAKYNMALNLDKCVNLTVNRTPSSIKFPDGSAVNIKRNIWALHWVTASITAGKCSNDLTRTGQASATASQLQLFWNKARTSIKWKLYSKLLYGLEVVQLSQSEQNRIDAFQMKIARRILRVPPTHIDRSWTNPKVIDTLTERYGYVHTKLSSTWKNRKVVLLGNALRAPPNDPICQGQHTHTHTRQELILHRIRRELNPMQARLD